MVGWNDERCNLAGRTPGFSNCFGRGCSHVSGAVESADPSRDGVRKSCHIRGERRIVTQVRGGVFAHDVHDGRARLAGIVEVGESVGEARPEVQERGGGTAGQAGVTVGRSRTNAFVQAEHTAHFRHAVQGSDALHLTGAWVHEANVDTVGEKRSEK
jgi:hypothetical protein